MNTISQLVLLICCLLVATILTCEMDGSQQQSLLVQRKQPVGVDRQVNCEACRKSQYGSVEYKPYLRNALARSAYNKLLADQDFDKFDTSQVQSHLIPAHQCRLAVFISYIDGPVG